MIAAVVFDLDGVLVDSEVVWERVRRAYVDEVGGVWKDEAQTALMGMSTPEWARYLVEELRVPGSPEEVAEQVIERMAADYGDDPPVLPGAPDAVRRMAARWPVGVASSSPRSLIEAVLNVTGLADLFAVTVSSEEVLRGKPAPDVYLAASERLAAAAPDCVAVEDSSNGVRSAAAAGMHVIAVPQARYPLDPDAAEAATVVLPAIGALTPEVIRRVADRP